jgi:hypothetical protein
MWPDGRRLAAAAWRRFASAKPILDKSRPMMQIVLVRYPVMLERIPEDEGMPGSYYAHVPTLGLTTHDSGMEGALEAARDLVALWNEE